MPRAQRWWLFALLVGALVLRLFFALVWHGNIARTDAPGYHQWAVSLVHEGTFPSALRPPGYSAIVAAHYALFGETQRPVYVGQALVGTLGVYVAYRLALELLGRQRRGLALLAATLFGLSPGVAFYAGWLWREAWMTLLAPLGLWLWLRMVQRSWRYGIPLGLLIGGAAYIRSDSVVVVTVLVLLSLLRPLWRWRALGGGLVAGVLATACVAPWIIHCAGTRGYASMDLSLPYNFYFVSWYLAPEGEVEPEFRKSALEEVRRRQLTAREQRCWLVASVLAEKLPPGDVRAEVELYKKMGAVARENIGRHFWRFLRGSVGHMWRNVAGRPTELWRDRMEPSVGECLREGYWGTLALKVFNRVVWPLIFFPLAAVGVVWAVRRRDASAWPLATGLGALLVLTLAMILIDADPRIRVPYDPPLLTAATLGFCALLRRITPEPGSAQAD